MKEDPIIEKRYKVIIETIETAYRCPEDLMDDPVFLDSVHGEQELQLDQTLELLDGIKYNFEPEFSFDSNGPERFGDADAERVLHRGSYGYVHAEETAPRHAASCRRKPAEQQGQQRSTAPELRS